MKKIVNFHDYYINKNSFHKRKKLFDVHKIDIRNIIKSVKDSYGKKIIKYFTGYRIYVSVAQVYINLSEMSEYVKYFDNNNNYLIFLVYVKKLLGKYNEIWDKISNLLKKDLIASQCIMINTLKLN